MTIKAGTLCYVAAPQSPFIGCPELIGAIVEAQQGEFPADDDWLASPYWYCEWRGRHYSVATHLLRPISDPDADVSERQDEREKVGA